MTRPTANDRFRGPQVAAPTELSELAATGKLRVNIAGEYPIEDGRAAYAVLAGGHAGGELILVR